MRTLRGYEERLEVNPNVDLQRDGRFGVGHGLGEVGVCAVGHEPRGGRLEWAMSRSLPWNPSLGV